MTRTSFALSCHHGTSLRAEFNRAYLPAILAAQNICLALSCHHGTSLREEFKIAFFFSIVGKEGLSLSHSFDVFCDGQCFSAIHLSFLR